MVFYIDILENKDKFEIDHCFIAFSAHSAGVYLVTFKGEEMTAKKFPHVSAAKKGFSRLYNVGAIWSNSPGKIVR